MKTLVLEHRFMTVRYEDLGTGLPVLLLHAFPFDRAMWVPQCEPIAAAGFRVLAPDLPEFGETTPGSEVFAIERSADVIADLLDEIDIEKAVIGGLSMGGYIAMAFARRHPQRLLALILADTKAAPDDAEGKAGRDRMIADVKDGGAAAAADALLPKLFSTATRDGHPEVIEQARAIILRQRAAAIIAALYALRDRPDAAPGLAAVTVPTLVLVGEDDAVTPPLASARIAGAIVGAELVHIPSAGHLSNLENSAAFNSAVISFLSKLK
jgi:pimeloyl-ACP methyl ester carboxylesterase